MTLTIDGAIDLDCHFSEDTLGGKLNPETGEWDPILLGGVPAYDVVNEARNTGHEALVLKSHSFATPALASALEAALPGIQLFSGICTDHMTGGLNVEAVAAALSLGARIVWLPTLHSAQEIFGSNFTGYAGEPVWVTDENGDLLPAVHEIFNLVTQAGAALATGHISADDHYAVARAFGSQGNVIVTHAGEELAGPRLDGRQCRELADLGATIEFTALTCTPIEGYETKSPQQIAEMIHTVGARHCTVASDYGWAPHLPRPAPGFKSFLESLWDCGIAETDLITMAKDNPRRLLDLAPASTSHNAKDRSDS